MDDYDVLVIGGGVAGLTAGLFTARHGFDTGVVDAGSSILRRNAHLENFPGFPGGVNARLFLDNLADQAEGAGVERTSGTVTGLDRDSEGFVAETDGGDSVRASQVVAATKNETGYLEGVDGVGIVSRGKTFVDTDDRGRTGVDGLYAAGRLAGKPHQAVVCAGHGAEVAVTLLDDHDRPFYHDWVAPEGYFTDRGRDLPPGCEEIDDAERSARERAAREELRDALSEPHPSDQPTHPSLEDD